MVSLVAVAVILLWGAVFQLPQAGAFKIFPSDASLNHQEITEIAIVTKVAAVCRDMATAQGKDFTLPANSKLTVATVQKACSSSNSVLSKANFKQAIVQISLSNIAVDRKQFSDAHHFDNEAFSDGRDLITKGIAKVKINLKEGDYVAARIKLGAVTHSLQDFYSHSNWVELGYAGPYSDLIKPDIPLTKTADSKTATCKNCVNDNCNDNILPEILQNKILTSGYFSLLLPNKPAGKCSHGGLLDATNLKDPNGGINKDDVNSDHGSLHLHAANMAISATMELLEHIRQATSETAFLRLLGLTQISALVFAIDTTGSMSDEIAEVKKVSINIIDSRKGTAEEPSEYMLITFNDADVGLTRTGDVDKFKQQINSLSASGGGDFPEMCLSGLLVALTRAPPSSDIFVFTDASAKDPELKSTVEAMIESTESTVTFLVTSSVSSRRKREVSDSQSSSSRPMSQSEIELYRDLTQVSGGQTLEVTKTTLSEASTAITDTFTSGLVTVLQVARSAGNAGNFSFPLDTSLSSVTVYITGSSLVFTLYSPTGVSQSDSVTDGSLGSIQTVGNLKKIKLKSNSQTGEWSININSTSSYTLRVIGQSSVNILSYFVEISRGGHSDSWGQIFTRPSIGQNATLFLSVTGGESVTVTDVLLVDASGSNVVNGSVTSVGGTDYLVSLNRIPEGAFGLRLKGLLNNSSSRFQRQSSNNHKGSRITVTAQTQNTITPGVPFSFNFTVSTNTTAGNYTIRARTSNGFSVSVPSSLNVESGRSAQGTATLTVPSITESGTDVTLTFEAEAPGSTDLNYAKLRLIVSAASGRFSGWYSFSMCLSLFGLSLFI
ncbi:von Willebrand factor A domain-containing protein 7 [Triplophysa rosa]|uniref:von Willebrand factor A domain-containing protein 7 n=1 Tax=Triplophysa rosa TaxID=992332 RepID=A0A9W7WZ36_TRIRA|nr:von Willebrand factor A domain-containing protein 7 [Triplophysa rosa]XP_057188705.1 von Willebrand factor A domain-containing protein 7 [Triplophysa rosa]KAI7810845.1 putative von Willebrand factor A domain-containing protein 7 [Triplophysa rosa]